MERALATELSSSGSGEHVSVLLIKLRIDARTGQELEAAERAALEAMQRSLRGGDSLYRIADLAFAALLPSTDRATALSLADRVREEIRLAAARNGNQVVPSVGLSLGPADGDSLDSLLRAAEVRGVRPPGHHPSVH
jgi:hypothetical protein